MLTKMDTTFDNKLFTAVIGSLSIEFSGLFSCTSLVVMVLFHWDTSRLGLLLPAEASAGRPVCQLDTFGEYRSPLTVSIERTQLQLSLVQRRC